MTQELEWKKFNPPPKSEVMTVESNGIGGTGKNVEQKHIQDTFKTGAELNLPESQAFKCPTDIYEGAIKAFAVAVESGSCPDHCVAMACEVVWQASRESLKQKLLSDEMVEKVAVANSQWLKGVDYGSPRYYDLPDELKHKYLDQAKAALQAVVGAL